MTKLDKEGHESTPVVAPPLRRREYRRDYRSPRLVHYGSLTELTALGGSISFDGLAGTELGT